MLNQSGLDGEHMQVKKRWHSEQNRWRSKQNRRRSEQRERVRDAREKVQDVTRQNAREGVQDV